MNSKFETHEHDVLIIGAGGAGLRAAIEALAHGASVGIVCKSLLGKAHTVMAEGGHQFEVQIHDTGIGIKAGDLNRLFTEFEQLDSGTARRFEGTGLGLALTKKIIEFQGGRISVESQPGKGSVFTVVLPVMTGEGKAA